MRLHSPRPQPMSRTAEFAGSHRARSSSLSACPAFLKSARLVSKQTSLAIRLVTQAALSHKRSHARWPNTLALRLKRYAILTHLGTDLRRESGKTDGRMESYGGSL